jgi:hypothetical protein
MKVVVMAQIQNHSASRSRPLAGEFDPPLAAGEFPPTEGRGFSAPPRHFFRRGRQTVPPACRCDHILALRVAARSRFAGLRYPSHSTPSGGCAVCHAGLLAASLRADLKKCLVVALSRKPRPSAGGDV